MEDKLTDIQKENIVDHIMYSQVRCKRCSKYDGDRSDKTDKQDVNYHCTVDTYDGRCWTYCFWEIYNYIENNYIYCENTISKERVVVGDYKITIGIDLGSSPDKMFEALATIDAGSVSRTRGVN